MAAHVEGIIWTDALSVGHRKLDGQHKGLIRLINRFGQDQMDPSEMAESIQGLIAYAARHFNDEESYILRNAPELLEHQVECHIRFIETAYDFAHRFEEGEGEALRVQVYRFLCDWLIKHIQEEDQQYNKARRES